MEVLKIDEWISNQTNIQFDVANKSKSPYFNRFVRRLFDGRIFEVQQEVYHIILDKKLHIYYFNNNYIHFVMENGEHWKANHVL